MSGSIPLADIVATWQAVRNTPARLEKRARLVQLLHRSIADEALRRRDVALAASWLAGEIPQGALGVGWSTLVAVEKAEGAAELPLFAAMQAANDASAAPVTAAELDGLFTDLLASAGPGVARRRSAALAGLLRRLSADERDFVRGLLLGELRQGALRALVMDAVATAFGTSLDEVRRAVMFSGSFHEVVATLVADGPGPLARFVPRIGVPIEPMLASPAEDIAAAFAGEPESALEWKLDGVRVQVHRDGDDVRVFSRQLRDVTALVPGVVALVRSFGATRFILDGEVVSFDDEGRPRAFQDLMSRFARQDETLRPAALAPMFFDVLAVDEASLVDRPYRERRAALERLVPEAARVPAWTPRDAGEAQQLFADALSRGHEGVMLKSLDSPYVAGKRGASWRKVKPAVTADLVILAAEWGHGRRRGFLSNIHLGARVPGVDGAPDTFAMLGKTFKGLTDAMLNEMTNDLLSLETHREGIAVHVRPERVVEIAFDALQRSPRYDSGFALRFARVKRFRPDKSAAEATALDELRR